jgi:hypothetical protein
MIPVLLQVSIKGTKHTINLAQLQMLLPEDGHTLIRLVGLNGPLEVEENYATLLGRMQTAIYETWGTMR